MPRGRRGHARTCGCGYSPRPNANRPSIEESTVDLTVIGMISGTSYDAVDAAVADLCLDGDEIICRPRGLHSQELPDKLRARLAAALPPHVTTLAEVCQLDTELGQLFGA